MMMGLDPMFFVFAVPGLLLGIYAQMKLSGTYGRYIQTGLATGVSGAEAAREILDRAGMHNMPINMVHGHLTDHYDPLKKALFLSEANYHGRSIAAVGVAAHEAGHALQHQAAYAPMKLRMAIVPVAGIATKAAFFLILIGGAMQMGGFILAGIAAYAILTAFQMITLPVEWDASRRAKQQLLSTGIVRQNEAGAVSKVLNAAGLTYVAAMVSSVMTLLYYLSIFTRSNDRD